MLAKRLRWQCSSAWEDAPLFGLEEAELIMDGILRGFIEQGHNESALLLGGGGTGKSALLHRIIQHNRSELVFPEQLKVIKLSGYLHHDPRVACETILEEIGDDQAQLATSFDEAGEKIMELLKDEDKSFVIILDQLDVFATMQRGKQSFLYFLFDAMHVPGVQLCIFGTSTRLDCISLLEKRVISRFSQIQIRFYPPADFIQYLLFVQSRLLINMEDKKETNLDQSKVKKFNHSIQKLLKEDMATISLLERSFEMTKNPRTTIELLRLAICFMKDDQIELTKVEFFQAYERLWIDPHTSLIEGLSILELCLVISFMTFEVNQEDPQYNFERSYENYKLFATATNAPGSLYSKPVALKAFETLLELEIIGPVKKQMDGKIPLEYREVRLTIDPNHVQEIVARSEVVTHLKNWASHLVIHVKN